MTVKIKPEPGDRVLLKGDRVMACANAFNMAAGYNGIESGVPVITSAAMVMVLLIKGHDAGAAKRSDAAGTTDS